MEYTLSMTFLTDTGLQSTLSISDVRGDITKEEVNSLMDLIIVKNIFHPKAGQFTHKESAQLSQKNVTKFTV